MGSLQIQFPQKGFIRIPSTHLPHPLHLKPPQTPFSRSLHKHLPNPKLASNSDSKFGFCSKPARISCGLRGGPRPSMWRSRVLSTEAIQVVQSLKLAKKSSRVEQVFNNKLCRLLKADLIDTLAELRRQNELDLAQQVFDFIRKEVWYKPELSLYCEMMLMYGRHQMIESVEGLFMELMKEGLVPDTRAYTEMIGAYLKVGMVDEAMGVYESMKKSGCEPDKLTLTILIRSLERLGHGELASVVKRDCVEYVDYPEKFIEEVGKKYPRRKSVGLV